jgi:hypothetical protein
MRTTYCLMLCVPLLLPAAALAQERCDGGGQIVSYLAGTTDSPAPAEISRTWVGRAVKPDVDPTAVTALRRAIEAFEGRRPSAEEAAEIAAGDWSGWRAGLMPRDDFVRGFLAEVARRAASQGEYAASLQAAQAMRNRLDDLYGAAGSRQPPEDPSAMWLWDQHMRTPGAADAVDRLTSLPDGEWLWNRYLIGRKTAIACALDAIDAPTQSAESNNPKPEGKPTATSYWVPSADEIKVATERAIAAYLAQYDAMAAQCHSVKDNPIAAMACLASGFGTANSKTMSVDVKSVELDECVRAKDGTAFCRYMVDATMSGQGAMEQAFAFGNALLPLGGWSYGSFIRRSDYWELERTYENCTWSDEGIHCTYRQ